MKSIDVLIDRINKVLAERRKDIEERENQLREAETASAQASELLSSAIDTGDTKVYGEAKRKKAQAEDDIELYTKRLARLKESPLITKEEYEKYSQNVHAELAEMTARHRREVVEIIDKLIAIREEERIQFEKGNDALKRWQHEVYHDADRLRYDNGKVMPGNVNRFNDCAVSELIGWIEDNGTYQAFKKEYDRQAEA